MIDKEGIDAIKNIPRPTISQPFYQQTPVVTTFVASAVLTVCKSEMIYRISADTIELRLKNLVGTLVKVKLL